MEAKHAIVCTHLKAIAGLIELQARLAAAAAEEIGLTIDDRQFLLDHLHI